MPSRVAETGRYRLPVLERALRLLDLLAQSDGASSVAGPVFRVIRQRLPEIVRAVKGTGRDLWHDLGFRP